MTSLCFLQTQDSPAKAQSLGTLCESLSCKAGSPCAVPRQLCPVIHHMATICQCISLLSSWGESSLRPGPCHLDQGASCPGPQTLLTHHLVGKSLIAGLSGGWVREASSLYHCCFDGSSDHLSSVSYQVLVALDSQRNKNATVN